MCICLWPSLLVLRGPSAADRASDPTTDWLTHQPCSGICHKQNLTQSQELAAGVSCFVHPLLAIKRIRACMQLLYTPVIINNNYMCKVCLCAAYVFFICWAYQLVIIRAMSLAVSPWIWTSWKDTNLERAVLTPYTDSKRQAPALIDCYWCATQAYFAL